MSTTWREDMLAKIKTPLKVQYGCICDADGVLLASINRESISTPLYPVERDQLANELVMRFNAYKGD